MTTWTNIKRIDDELEHVAKFVFTNDNAVVESVLYRYPTYEERTVVCFSVQSGCPIGCRFCGTGNYFNRNLTTQEILDQVDYSLEQTGIDPTSIKKLQLMSMSMGEPLLNLKALIPALYTLHENYPQAALLISTSGPDVDYNPLIQAAMELPTIGLQFSVHESTDEARNRLVPFKNKLTLEGMSTEGSLFKYFTGRKPYFNYCAHDGNVSDEDAARIVDLYPPDIFCATVSVICEQDEGVAASNDHQRNLALTFGDKLLKLGYDVRVFDPAGQDTIGGGCGQLHFVQDWFRENPDFAKPSVGFGKEKIHAPK